MTKKKKKSEEPNPKILSEKDRKESIDKLNSIDKGAVYIPVEAIINVPISGSFRLAIEETLHYIMSQMTSDEIITSMYHMKTNYTKMEGQPTLRDRSLWTVMSLLQEINMQAADQKLTRYTDKPVNEELAGILNKMQTEDAESIDSIQEIGRYNMKYKNFFNSDKEDKST
tara:strand:+ start:182 stop:691 length:510 start_codon:yes stop_codon:yes gene_type:complete